MVSSARLSLCVALSFLLVAGPAYAQTGTSTAPTSTPSSSNSSNAALGIGLGIGAGIIGLGLLSSFVIPTPGRISFGGRIATVIPCSLGLHVTIIPAGAFPAAYVWTPATLTFLTGPPRNPGQQVLGLADFPVACFVGKVPFFGLRMFMVGTSGAI